MRPGTPRDTTRAHRAPAPGRAMQAAPAAVSNLRLAVSRRARALAPLVVRLLLASFVALLPLFEAQPAPAFAATPCDPPITNPIVCENSKPGNPKSEWDISGSGDPSIQGFATDISVNRGETIAFKIKTDAAAYRLDVYRMGYYGGLGARKIASLSPSAALPQTQPACLTDTTVGVVDCGNWGVSASWAVPADVVSGIYFAKLVRTDTGGASHITFVVRDDSSTSDLFFQASDTTWQAYNEYGGSSTYVSTNLVQGRAYKVSYNRPFALRGVQGGLGVSNFVFYGEYPMVRWLEANGYSVSYTTNTDTDRRGALIKNHKVFLSVGHDEYWSAAQRANVEAARDAGVNIAFFSGNISFWKTRFEADANGAAYRTLVTYKETKGDVTDPQDPPTWTGTWRDPTKSPPADGGRPENELIGTLFTVNRGSGALQVPEAEGKLRLWRNSSVATLAPGQVATLAADTVGYEWDEDVDNGLRPAGTIRLSSTTLNVTDYLLDYGNTYAAATATHRLTLYRAPSGALVFSAGSVQWSWGLDVNHDTTPDTGSATPDPRMQQATVNLFADMGVQPGTLQAGLVAASKSTDLTAPTASISAPANNASVPVNTAVTISGTASDSGGRVGGVEVSLDNGATWHPATGRESWSYTWTPRFGGPATILARPTDDSANIGAPSAGVTVNVTGDTTAPTISAVAVKSIMDTGATVTWTTNEPATSQVEYGTTTAYGTSTPADPTLVTSHSVQLSGLAASTTYNFRVLSKDAVNNAASSANFVFTTSAPGTFALVGEQGTQPVQGTNAPGTAEVFQYLASTSGTASRLYLYLDGANTATSIVVGLYTNTTNNDAGTLLTQGTISNPVNGAWNGVDVPATSIVAGTRYWIAILVPSGGGQIKYRETNNGGRTQASVQTNLTALPQTWAVGANYSSSPLSAYAVQVGGTTADTQPPVATMTAPAAGATVSGTSVAVSADASDNVGVASVQFLLDGAPLGSPITTAPYSLTWDSTTTFNGTHTLGAQARDAAGNIGTATAVSVTVSNTDTVPPTISGVAASGITTAGATIAWTTNEPATSQVEYGTTTAYGLATTLDPALVASHSQPLSGLQPGTTYQYRVVSKDAAGNVATSGNFSFTTATPDTTPPSITGVQASGITAAGATITWSTDEAADSQVEYGPTTAYGTSTPLAAEAVTAHSVALSGLAPGTVYNYRVKSKDAAGNLATSANFTFTTQSCPCTIWNATAAPTVPAANDSGSVELGVKFRTDIAGYVSGVRFYKGSTNTGTHVGSLWSSTGALLAQATFVGESASGWQQVSFASPVAVTANTTYVASYFAPAGNYAADAGFFTGSGVANAPLQALASGVDGPNGVYAYGSTSTLPNQSYNATNYWVDVVFTTSSADTSPPTLSGVQATAISGTGATITWSTNEAADSQVEYGTTTAYGTTTPVDARMAVNHSVALSGLAANTLYNYRVKSKDAAGNLATSANFTFTTTAPPTCPCTIWADTATPAVAATSDGQPIEVGVKFRAETAGYISGVRFYKGAANTGTHVGSLWSSTGTLLAQATFANETASGWQQVSFASPVAVTANTTYVASYNSSSGYYAVDGGYFIGKGADRAPLHALANGVDGGNGVFLYGPSAFPTQTFNGGNYWVDVVFTTSATDTTPPAVTDRTPAPNATDASTGTKVTATFGEAVTATSISFVLRDAANVTVPSAVAYDAPSRTATLTPSAPLAEGKVYTATLSGAADAAGNVMAPLTWSFTTQACPCSIWGSAATPAGAANDGQPIQVGVKFRADRDGYVSGVRFYKPSGSSGTHVGSLWSSTGTLLASATFAGETASGWQQVLFATPVKVTANTTYVAASHAAGGGYAVDAGYFTGKDTVSGPVRALRDGLDGGNGVFAYGTASTFPAQTYNASNYWVDVVFSTTATDTVAPTISAVKSSGITATGATITWSTDEAADSQVEYGPTTSYGTSTPLAAAAVTAHSVALSGLAPGTVYNYRVKSKDAAGNLATSANFTFTTTAAPASCPCTIWDSSAVPATVSVNDGSAIELGLKFRSEVAGNVTGVRFYKGSTNTGTHVGSLWSSTGTLLAQATFAGETASGWQQVSFSVPVAIQANTTYVVSYRTSTGYYSATPGQFATSGVDRAPLHALANGVDGTNGVYLYGPGGFPTNSYNATNYWVDVVFTTAP